MTHKAEEKRSGHITAGFSGDARVVRDGHGAARVGRNRRFASRCTGDRGAHHERVHGGICRRPAHHGAHFRPVWTAAVFYWLAAQRLRFLVHSGRSRPRYRRYCSGVALWERVPARCRCSSLRPFATISADGKARIRQSYVSLVGGVAPIVAPTVGVWVAAAGGWRAIYGALAGGGVVLFFLVLSQMKESIAAREHHFLSARSVLRNYVRVLRHPVSCGYAVVVALCFGCLFAYVFRFVTGAHWHHGNFGEAVWRAVRGDFVWLADRFTAERTAQPKWNFLSHIDCGGVGCHRVHNLAAAGDVSRRRVDGGSVDCHDRDEPRGPRDCPCKRRAGRP